MGNSLGGKKSRAKVMQISGKTFKLKTPVEAGEVVKEYPGHVLLKSEEVKHFGIRARPLEPHQQLEPRGLYFLVELPNVVDNNVNNAKEIKVPRRVRSGINMSAKDRLESLMLSRRSVSDLSVMKSSTAAAPSILPEEEMNGAVRVRMRLPKAQVEMLMKQSRDQAEAAEKIVDLCMVNTNQQMHWNNNAHHTHERALKRQATKAREKRVSFRPANEGEIQISCGYLTSSSQTVQSRWLSTLHSPL